MRRRVSSLLDYYKLPQFLMIKFKAKIKDNYLIDILIISAKFFFATSQKQTEY